MKTIMVATDFSERSDRALRRATLLARQSGAELSIIHVVDDDQSRRIVEAEREVAEDLLRELRKTVKEHDGVACRTRVILGAPFEGITNAAGDLAPDLLVIGPHRRQALRDVFVGTTAERVIRNVSLPVLMVNAPPVGAYRQALLTTDFSEGARQAIAAFKGLELAPESHLLLVYVFDAPAAHLALRPADWSEADYVAERRDEAARDLVDFVGRLGVRIDRPILRQQDTTPADEILAVAAEGAADLVVLGTRGRSGLERFLLGSVAEEVLRKAERDVLAVPPHKD